jgi:hypothetical protein
MPIFRSYYVGGPADGLPLETRVAPTAGDYSVWETQNGVRHLYVFKCAGWLPPNFRHVRILSRDESLAYMM